MKRRMLVFTLVALLPLSAFAQTAARAHPAPYARLANDLETPNLVDSEGPKDKSLLKLRFVGNGQTDTDWVKMTSVSIAKVKPEDTTTATRSIIAKFKASLESQKHAKVKTFETSTLEPQAAYFEFSGEDGTAEQGIAYSPASGFVSIVQVAYKHGYVHAASDRDLLKRVIAAK